MPRIFLLGIFITVRKLLLIIVTPSEYASLICDSKVMSVPTDDLDDLLRDLYLHRLAISLLKERSCCISALRGLSALAKGIISHSEYLAIMRHGQEVIRAT